MANAALQLFNKSLADASATECSIKLLDKSTCHVNNIDLTDCADVTIDCCNDSAASVLDCTSSFINKQAASAMATVYGNMPAGLQSSMSNKVLSYLENTGHAASSVGYADTASLTQALETYVATACTAQAVNDQAITVPSLKGTKCDTATILLYNRSDVNVRCAAGAITNLMPTTAITPAKRPWLTQATVLYLVILSVIIVFFGLFLAVIDSGRKS